uniref:F-box protein 40 n=1 Tax=Amphilophus citrinellus TaxID=61819 RepID=A0A3Q0TA33_AMPCI
MKRDKTKSSSLLTKVPVGYHKHCDKCYDVHCQVPAQTSVSCTVIKCHKNCGASLHTCKQEEHQLLCPNETVPCLNAYYGCPLTMLRCRLAKHLEVCPASVVCCSQEWNRWPISETDLTFYRNVSEKPLVNTEENLDVAMALRDQEQLFQSIKMKNVFPELMLEDSALQNITAGIDSPAGKASCSSDCGEFAENGSAEMEKEPSQEERDTLAKCTDVTSIQNYSSWEKIFNKEREGCKQTVKNLSKGEKDGVLERLGKEVNIAEYNMYLVHNGVMLINFGQLAACTPREKDFVYGSLEPIEVKSVRSFNVPTSYRAKRSHLKDPLHKAQTTHQSVDTSDLGISIEDLPKCEEVSTTLLCSLEKELKGHSVSESVSTDGLYTDTGTQTYIFASAPFKHDASLADVIAGKSHGLYLHIEAESVTRRHNKTSSAFSYTCGRYFRRDEYGVHFKNFHSDIQASLSGWFQQRCPLAYLGCTFTQMRFQPTGQQATIKFCRDVGTLVLQPEVPSSLCEAGKTVSPQRNDAHNLDPLSSLPLEIIQHIAGYLDSFALSQLSQVSHLMREVCATLLQERGMVSLKWEKEKHSREGSSWICQEKVWKFSSQLSSVDRWSFSNTPSMSNHLGACSFYQREDRTEPVALPCLGERSVNTGNNSSLLSLF